jgi:hypothetical protein
MSVIITIYILTHCLLFLYIQRTGLSFSTFWISCTNFLVPKLSFHKSLKSEKLTFLNFSWTNFLVPKLSFHKSLKSEMLTFAYFCWLEFWNDWVGSETDCIGLWVSWRSIEFYSQFTIYNLQFNPIQSKTFKRLSISSASLLKTEVDLNCTSRTHYYQYVSQAWSFNFNFNSFFVNWFFCSKKQNEFFSLFSLF